MISNKDFEEVFNEIIEIQSLEIELNNSTESDLSLENTLRRIESQLSSILPQNVKLFS